jgi:hypothetical protein
MEDPSCRRIGIPSRLHTGDRSPDPAFSDKELLYRRYKLHDVQVSKKPFPENLWSVSISFKRGLSVNRQKYSAHPADVLFEVNSGDHYKDDGVCELNLAGLNEWSKGQREDTIPPEYTLEVVHEPTRCMYPHTSVYLLHRNTRIDEPRGGGLKMQIKRSIAKAGSLKDLGKQQLPRS